MAGIIYHDKYKQLVQVDNRSKMAVEKYEQTNIPATILGATASRWKYMPSFKTAHDENSSSAYCGGALGGWTFLNLLSRFIHIYWRFSDTHLQLIPNI